MSENLNNPYNSMLTIYNTKYILARLRKSSFVKNVLIVMSGTAAAQIIGFALTPIISRLFSPSDFGVFGAFNSIASIIAAGVTLEYTQAIMLPKQKEDAINIFILSCVSTAVISVCCMVVFLLAPNYLLGIMKIQNTWMLMLLVGAIFVTGFNQACQAWNVRAKAFKHTSASQVIRSISANGTQIGFGYLKGGATGLIVSNVLGDMLASINLFRVLLPDLLAFRYHIRWDRLKQLAKDYMDFPIYAASQNVINALSQGLPVLLLAHFYGIVVAGAYAFGLRIIQTPMGLVMRALRQVLLQKAGEIQHQDGKLAPMFVKITAGLFALALVPAMVLFVGAPQIFTWVFGSQWHMAGEFAQSLVLWMIFYFSVLPAVLFARFIRIQRTIFFYDIVLLAARALVLVLGGMYLSASYTIMLFALVGAAMNSFLIILVGHAVMKKEGHTNWGRIRDCLKEI